MNETQPSSNIACRSDRQFGFNLSEVSTERNKRENTKRRFPVAVLTRQVPFIIVL